MTTKQFKLKQLNAQDNESARIIELDFADHAKLFESLMSKGRDINGSHFFTLCYMSSDGRAATVNSGLDIPKMLAEFEHKPKVDLFVHDSKSINCMVCNKGFTCEGDRIPLLLHCKHSVCAECFIGPLALRHQLQAKVASSTSSSGAQCPICQSVTDLGTMRMESLKNVPLLNVLTRMHNHQIAGLTGSSPQTKVCSECDEQPASLFCQNCRAALCDNCSERIHKVAKVMQAHVVVALSEAESSWCQEHSRETEVFCYVCNKIVCYQCTYDGGKCFGHSSATTEKVALRREDELQAQSIKLAELNTKLDEHLTAVDQLYAQTSKTATESSVFVKNTMSSLHTTVDNKQAAMLGDIKRLQESKSTIFSRHKAHLQMAKDCVQTIQHTCMTLKRPVAIKGQGTSQNVNDVHYVSQSTSCIGDARAVQDQFTQVNKVNIAQYVQGQSPVVLVTSKHMEQQKEQLQQKMEHMMGTVVSSLVELQDEETRLGLLRDVGHNTNSVKFATTTNNLNNIRISDDNGSSSRLSIPITAESNALHLVALLVSTASVGVAGSASPVNLAVLPGVLFALTTACLANGAIYCGYDIRALCLTLQPHLQDQQRLKNFLQAPEVAELMDINLQYFQHFSPSLPYAIFNLIESTISVIQNYSPAHGFDSTLATQLLNCKDTNLVPQPPQQAQEQPMPPAAEENYPPQNEQPLYQGAFQDVYDDAYNGDAHGAYNGDAQGFGGEDYQEDQQPVYDESQPFGLAQIPGHRIKFFYDDEGKQLFSDNGVPYFEYELVVYEQ